MGRGRGACWTEVQEHGRWARVINSWVEAEGLELFDFNKLLGAMVGLRRVKLLYNLFRFHYQMYIPVYS